MFFNIFICLGLYEFSFTHPVVNCLPALSNPYMHTLFTQIKWILQYIIWVKFPYTFYPIVSPMMYNFPMASRLFSSQYYITFNLIKLGCFYIAAGVILRAFHNLSWLSPQVMDLLLEQIWNCLHNYSFHVAFIGVSR